MVQKLYWIPIRKSKRMRKKTMNWSFVLWGNRNKSNTYKNRWSSPRLWYTSLRRRKKTSMKKSRNDRRLLLSGKLSKKCWKKKQSLLFKKVEEVILNIGGTLFYKKSKLISRYGLKLSSKEIFFIKQPVMDSRHPILTNYAIKRVQRS
jgi:hypothetical protein